MDFELFHTMSKSGKGYKNRQDCLRYWNLCRTSNINKGLLHSLAKRANEEKYRELWAKIKLNSLNQNLKKRILLLFQIDFYYQVRKL